MQFFENQAKFILGALDINVKLSDAEQAELESFKGKQDTFASHQLKVKSHVTQLTTDLVIAFEVFIVMAVLLRILAEVFWRTRQSCTRFTSASKFLDASESKKWQYVSQLCSYPYSVVLLVSCIYATMHCEIEGTPGSRNDAAVNLFTNTYCRDNTQELQLRVDMVAAGIMLGDLFICIVLVRDFTSGSALQMFLHHTLAIIGALSGMYVGRFIGTISVVSLVTECTTPLVNNRWFLYFHGKTESTFYTINGAMMTIGFLIFRFLFLGYLVIYILLVAL